MPRILAVDDSATMRRVLELTFAGQEGIEIAAVSDGAAAVRAAAQHLPDLILADASMAGMDGYEVAKAIRAAGGQAPIILLASQHTPFDAERARAAGIDDHVLKPFDTQSMIDKAKDVMTRGRRPLSAMPAARSATGTTQSQPAVGRPNLGAPVGSPVAASPKVPARPTANFGPGSTTPSPAVASPAPARPMVPPTAVVGGPRPAPAPAAPAAVAAARKPQLELAEDEQAAPAAAAPVSAAAAAATAAMAGKLGGMGLTPAQVEGVLALSREVIERVVWEVVPDLAETIIREEIKRLTS